MLEIVPACCVNGRFVVPARGQVEVPTLRSYLRSMPPPPVIAQPRSLKPCTASAIGSKEAKFHKATL